MSYRNIERNKELESTVEKIRWKVEKGKGSKGVIKYFKEKEPVDGRKREFWIEYNPEAEKPFVVRVNKRQNDDIYDEYSKKGDAEDRLTDILQLVTDDTDYKVKTSDGLHFKMVKSGLNTEEEVVQEKTVGMDSRNLSETIDEYFASDEEYVMEKVKENAHYGEAVGQGLRSQVEVK